MAKTAGTLTPGSVQHRVANMKVGTVLWIETTTARYAQVQREWNLPKSRRIEALKNARITCSVWTALSPVVGQAPKILVRVERVE